MDEILKVKGDNNQINKNDINNTNYNRNPNPLPELKYKKRNN